VGTRTIAIALSAALAAIGGVSAAVGSGPPPNEVLAMGTVSPAKLPRSGQAPVTLRMGFQSSPIGGLVPELDKISFEVTRHVELSAEDWPQSCSPAKLYSPQVDARRACAGSLIGHGSVTSEITVPGQAPVNVTGRLLAFYASAGGRPRILAQVTTGEPLPLVYVIPFTIEPAAGSYGTTLAVSQERMRAINGRCASGHPNCFGPDPYTLEGVYGHISRLSMSLHRVVPQRGRGLSFVEGGCPVPPDFSTGVFDLLRISLGYADGTGASLVVYAACRALGD
jgi:hypothetical protein